MEKKDETINDRVRALRETGLEMTQKEFAQKINLETSNSISMIEREKNALTKQNIEFICTPNRLKKGYTVNENWLRTGEGEMFTEQPEQDPPPPPEPPAYDQNGKRLTPEEAAFMGSYRKLTDINREVARATVAALLSGQIKTAASYDSGAESPLQQSG